MKGKIGANPAKTVTKQNALERKREGKKKLGTRLTATSAYAVTEQKLIYLVFAWRPSTVFDRCAMHPVIRAERDVSMLLGK